MLGRCGMKPIQMRKSWQWLYVQVSKFALMPDLWGVWWCLFSPMSAAKASCSALCHSAGVMVSAHWVFANCSLCRSVQHYGNDVAQCSGAC